MPPATLLAWTLSATTGVRCFACPLMLLWGVQQQLIPSSWLNPLVKPYLPQLLSPTAWCAVIALLLLEIASEKAGLEAPVMDAFLVVARPLLALLAPIVLLPYNEPSTLLAYAAAYGASALQLVVWLVRVTGGNQAYGWRPSIQLGVSLARDLVGTFCAFLALQNAGGAATLLIILVSSIGPVATRVTRDLDAQDRARELALVVQEAREATPQSPVDVQQRTQG